MSAKLVPSEGFLHGLRMTIFPLLQSLSSVCLCPNLFFKGHSLILCLNKMMETSWWGLRKLQSHVHPSYSKLLLTLLCSLLANYVRLWAQT